MSEEDDARKFHRNYLTLQNAINEGDMRQIARSVSTEKAHEFESAGAFIERLAQRIALWRESTPEDAQPTVLAMLQNGGTMEVVGLGEDGHSGIVVEGIIDDNPCMMLTHQSSLQILCYTQRVEPGERRTIGFQVGGREFEA